MFISSLFSAISLFTVLIYIYIGIYVFKQNTKSVIHRVFLLLCLSYAIWSFAYAFAYISHDKYIFSIWNKISALGWCSFSAISLYLVLLITESRLRNKIIVKILIFLPAVVFFYMSVFLFGVDIKTPPIISNTFYVGNFLYNFTFLLISIVILFFWGLKTDSIRIKKQSRILVLSSITPFTLNLITQTILPRIGITQFPLMGQLYSIIMIIGVYIVITRYKFLKLPEEFIFEEIGHEMMDMVILLNEKRKIVKVTQHTLRMLGFDENEILDHDINLIIDENNVCKMSIDKVGRDNKRYNDINLLKKNGEKLPVNISCTPIFDSTIHDFLGFILVIQDISIVHELRIKNAELEKRAIRDSLTNLYNHQYSIELLERVVNETKTKSNRKAVSVMMIDIDYFKNINDQYGHQFGDYVLKIIANILINNVGDNGYVGRYGGEEFIIILTETDIKKAYKIGEKIKNEISSFRFGKDSKVTISIGIKELIDESSVEMIIKSDELLYKAKQDGRNRIEFSS
jgi:two-component system cell cycle response regulator